MVYTLKTTSEKILLYYHNIITDFYDFICRYNPHLCVGAVAVEIIYNYNGLSAGLYVPLAYNIIMPKTPEYNTISRNEIPRNGPV